jgi:hypothetical protein
MVFVHSIPFIDLYIRRSVGYACRGGRIFQEAMYGPIAKQQYATHKETGRNAPQDCRSDGRTSRHQMRSGKGADEKTELCKECSHDGIDGQIVEKGTVVDFQRSKACATRAGSGTK